jgi:putative membrane protein
LTNHAARHQKISALSAKLDHQHRRGVAGRHHFAQPHQLRNKLENLLIASLLLGILNAFVRPILMLIALPLLIFTLGLFTLVINALLLCLLTVLLPFFHVDSFGYAFLGALIISVISVALNVLTGNARVSVQRRRPPGPPKNSGGGNGR